LTLSAAALADGVSGASFITWIQSTMAASLLPMA